MESESNNFRVEKLNDSNFHAWKKKILLLLASKDLDEIIQDEEPELKDSKFKVWRRRDKKHKLVLTLHYQIQCLKTFVNVKQPKRCGRPFVMSSKTHSTEQTVCSEVFLHSSKA